MFYYYNLTGKIEEGDAMKTVNSLTLVIFSLLLCTLMFGVQVNASTEAVLRVEPKKNTVNVGSSLEVDVAISNVFDLYGYEFQLYYNTTMLTVTDMTPHADTTNEADFFYDEYEIWCHEMHDDPWGNGTGYVWLAVTPPIGTRVGRSDFGRLATIVFKAEVEGQTALTFPHHLLCDTTGYSIIHAVVPANVVVGATTETNLPPLEDETPPSGGIKIAEGASYTNQPSVKLRLFAHDEESGIDQMRFSNDADAWTEWEKYADIKDWTLTQGEGKKTVYVQYKDKAGLESLAYSGTILLDTTPPTIAIDWPSPGSEIKSSITQVQWIGTDAGSGVDHFEVRVDGGSWRNVGNNAAHVLSELSDGSHTVEVKITDKAGNSRTTSVNFTVSASVNRGPLYTDAIVGATVIAPIVGLAVYFIKSRKKT